MAAKKKIYLVQIIIGIVLFLLALIALLPFVYMTLISFTQKKALDFRFAGEVFNLKNYINVFGVFLIRQFMVGVPDELIEAARIDGCSDFRIFLQIVIPLIKPVLVSLTIFTFITNWNDFLWPLVICTDEKMHTLTLAISALKGTYSTNYGLVMAGSTLAFFPPFLLYLVLQKQFVEGIALSGIKG